jgi:hypothetical protein
VQETEAGGERGGRRARGRRVAREREEAGGEGEEGVGDGAAISTQYGTGRLITAGGDVAAVWY